MPDNVQKNQWTHSHTLAAIGLSLQLILMGVGGLAAFFAVTSKIEVINTKLTYIQAQVDKVQNRTDTYGMLGK